MFEQSPKSNQSEEKIQLLDVGIEIPIGEYETYKEMAINFLNNKAVSGIEKLSNEERARLSKVTMQMAKSLERFSDMIKHIS